MKFGIGLVCLALAGSSFAAPVISQYLQPSNLLPVINAGKTLDAPVVEFTTFKLDSSYANDVNSTAYTGSATGEALKVYVSNTSGQTLYVYVANGQSATTTFSAYQVVNSPSGTVVPLSTKQALPVSGSVYIYVATSPYNGFTGFNGLSPTKLYSGGVCQTSGLATTAGVGYPYLLNSDQGQLQVSISGAPGKSGVCRFS